MGCGSILQSAIAVFFEYDTPRIVHIRSKKVGVINRFIQLVIIGYVIGYAIVWKKGYQEFDDVQSAVTTKLKGVVYVNHTEYPDITTSVWDVAEYVVPPQENNAFFVITNLLETPKQSIGICPEDPGVFKAKCKDDSDCKKGKTLPAGNGVMTGKCDQTCMIHAWCPVENGTLKAPENPALLGSKDFTVFIKNNIQFPKFGVKRRNLPDNATDKFFQTCKYATNRDCPIFRLETIATEAGIGDYKTIAKEGGVVEIQIVWNCNLDHSVSDCVPQFKFRRLDSADYKISKGYNFRYAKYFRENETEYRRLIKAFGVKYILSVTGQAGKFNLVPLLTNIGSGMALLGIATILCDIVVLYVLKGKDLYKKKKYLEVMGDDAYKPDDTQPIIRDGSRSSLSTKETNTKH